ncbi:MAG: DUF3883 domain-containing protein [Burkholderiales bacterium]|nr:DUF3883 domain-containing protein [Burkholderiales bacterium]
MDWSQLEAEAIVADYLQMLALELSGQKFSKSQHRSRLKVKLNGRSDGSIEFKHCNISAVMLDLGFPSIQGYRARFNYQTLLAEVVTAQVQGRHALDQIALAAVQQPAVAPSTPDFAKVKAPAPVRQHRASQPEAPHIFKAFKRDYLAREAANTALGIAGEEFVVQFEHWRLFQLGQRRLADKVEHVAKTKGDGLGYDVLSFETDGKERLIEVKTTAFGRETPFFVSNGEIALSKQARDQFHLYRLFEFRKEPRMFDLPGQLDHHCVLDPVTYRASFN